MDRFKTKILLALLVIIESVSMYIPGAPIWLRYPGRLIIPIAVFLLVEGYLKTSNRDEYLKRLIFYAETVFIGNTILELVFLRGVFNNILPHGDFVMSTFLIVCGIALGSIILTYFVLNGRINDKKGIVFAAYLLISNLLIQYLFNYKVYVIPNNIFLMLVTSFLFLNAITAMEEARNSKNFTKELVCVSLGILTEGIIIVPALTYLFYKARNSRKMIYQGIIILSALFLAGFNIQALLAYPQWMMVFSIIFIYFYNGNEGKKVKKLYYVGYPIVVWGTYIIGSLML